MSSAQVLRFPMTFRVRRIIFGVFGSNMPLATCSEQTLDISDISGLASGARPGNGEKESSWISGRAISKLRQLLLMSYSPFLPENNGELEHNLGMETGT